MKASLKFREDQKPLVRAKIPLSILGLPFLSGISAGDSKELRLDLITAFDSGPSFRVSYRPNDSCNPFSLSIKTGVGSFGSPIGAPMSMSAEFNLVSRGGNPNPSFTVIVKPQIGDFSFKKSTKSVPMVVDQKIAVDPETDGDGSAVWVEKPPLEKVSGFSTTVWPTGGGIGGLLTGVEASARSVLPLRSKAAVRFRWGVRVPAELRTAFVENSRISFNKLPLLVMSKISIEHVAENRKAKGEEAADASKGAAAEVAEACLSVKRQLEAIQAENGMLRKAVEELRAEFGGGGRVSPVTGGQVTAGADVSKGEKRDRWGERKSPEVSGKASTKEDVSEELKKALMGATGGGI